MGFPRQEYWGELPFPSPGDLTYPGMEPRSPALAGGFFTTETPGEPSAIYNNENSPENTQNQSWFLLFQEARHL